jgi:hypothetical protein
MEYTRLSISSPAASGRAVADQRPLGPEEEDLSPGHFRVEEGTPCMREFYPSRPDFECQFRVNFFARRCLLVPNAA